ncbi:FtsX-like permease family protein [Acetobacter musti]|uniref:FtsX-like permease family protein n=1 Tax=Acetobacter musti TaxID=864732 RepID=A0ABX0JV26_9PROT|nr:ABC transporter permease [Acetobacter musti]NHN86674.1 FtsX-like permease family protein [Acetobacter musti]
MFQAIFDGALREARRHPLHTALNILGLAVGVCVFLTLGLLVRYEYSYNASVPDADRIVRLDSHWSLAGTASYESAFTSFRAVPFLRDDFPEIENAVRIIPATLQVRREGQFTSFTSYQVDPTFFQVFGLRLIRGLPTNALSRPEGLVLSEGAAQRLFGKTDVIGHNIELVRDGQKTSHIVTGVLAQPAEPGVLSDAEILVPIPTEDINTRSCFQRWGSACGRIYLKLHNVTDISTIGAQLRDFVIHRASGADSDETSLGTHPEQEFSLSLVPLLQQHFYDITVRGGEEAADRNVVNSIGITGFLALMLACANAVNLATARAMLRAREVAVCKTLGASRRRLFIQFMGEALLTVATACLAGLALCEVLTPVVASLSGQAVTVRYGFVLLLWPLIVIGSGLASGIYPAVVLSRYRPAAILAATRMPSGGRMDARLRNALVVVQFAIAVTIVICTFVIDRQTAFIRNADRGYTMSGLLVGSAIPAKDLAIQHKMLDALQAVPGVKALTFGELGPNPPNQNKSTYKLVNSAEKVRVHLLFDRAGSEYFETYNPRLLAGRWFDPKYGQDEGPDNEALQKGTGNFNVVVNETAALRFGFTTPDAAVDKVISDQGLRATIIGVISDFRFVSPHEPVEPEIIYYNSLTRTPFDEPIPAVRFDNASSSEMVIHLNRAWASVLPDTPANFQSVDDRTLEFYQGDERRGRIFTLGAIAALLIACLGLYSLASFTAVRRTHEIGIRKTLGASARQIILLLLGDFLRPVLLACVIASPIAWFAMRSWLSGFDQRIVLGPIHFLTAISGALFIAAMTVLGQTLRVARSEPARALRAE